MIGSVVLALFGIVLFIIMKLGKALEASRGRAVIEAFRAGGLASGRRPLDAAYPKPTRQRFMLLGAIGDLRTLAQELAGLGTSNWRGVWCHLYGLLALATFTDQTESAAVKMRDITSTWAPKAGAFRASVEAFSALCMAIHTGDVSKVSVPSLAKAIPGQAIAQGLLYHGLAKAHARGGRADMASQYAAQGERYLPCMG